MMLVDLIADGWWRMSRANRYESELVANELEEMKRKNGLSTDPHPRDDRGIAIMMSREEYDQAFKTMFRYSDRATSKYFRALQQLEKMQRARRRDEEKLGSFGEAHECEEMTATAPAAILASAPAEDPELGSFGVSDTISDQAAPEEQCASAACLADTTCGAGFSPRGALKPRTIEVSQHFEAPAAHPPAS
jgi:hypothetical protein